MAPAGRLLKKAADAVLGCDCALCLGRSPGALVCSGCERDLAPAPPEPGVIAAFQYAFPLDRLVRRFKFSADLAAGQWLAERLADRVAAAPRPSLLVAPPLAPSRLRGRGFNQALEVAKTVGRRHAIAVDRHGLSRSEGVAPQLGLTRAQRLANLQDAFTCRLDLAGRDVAVVDDVLTTGATFEALAQVLRRHGAGDVQAWVIARTPERGA